MSLTGHWTLEAWHGERPNGVMSEERWIGFVLLLHSFCMSLLGAMSSSSKLAARQPGQSCGSDATPSKDRKQKGIDGTGRA